MNIVLTAAGSTADIQPFLPLAAVLSRHGQNVAVCSHDIYAEIISGRNVHFVTCRSSSDLEETDGLCGQYRY